VRISDRFSVMTYSAVYSMHDARMAEIPPSYKEVFATLAEPLSNK